MIYRWSSNVLTKGGRLCRYRSRKIDMPPWDIGIWRIVCKTVKLVNSSCERQSKQAGSHIENGFCRPNKNILGGCWHQIAESECWQTLYTISCIWLRFNSYNVQLINALNLIRLRQQRSTKGAFVAHVVKSIKRDYWTGEENLLAYSRFFFEGV